MVRANSTCFGVRLPSGFSASCWPSTRMEFSGVRSSCDMLARNSDLYFDLNGARKLDLFRRQAAVGIFGELLAQHEDGIQRRAELVRHVGQELGLVFRSEWCAQTRLVSASGCRRDFRRAAGPARGWNSAACGARATCWPGTRTCISI